MLGVWSLVAAYFLLFNDHAVLPLDGGAFVVLFTAATYVGVAMGAPRDQVVKLGIVLGGLMLAFGAAGSVGPLIGRSIAVSGLGYALGTSVSMRLKVKAKDETRQLHGLLLMGGDVLIVAGLIFWTQSHVIAGSLLGVGIGVVLAAYVLRWRAGRTS